MVPLLLVGLRAPSLPIGHVAVKVRFMMRNLLKTQNRFALAYSRNRDITYYIPVGVNKEIEEN